MHLGQPCPMFPKERFEGGITNGANWYAVTGGMQDWNYLAAGCMELTLEIGCYKYPHAGELPEMWLDNREALLTYIEQVIFGGRGGSLDFLRIYFTIFNLRCIKACADS